MRSTINIGSAVCIGSGGLSWSLVPALHRAGCRVVQVFSRKMQYASALSALVGAQAIDNLSHCTNADIVILAVPDDAVQSLLPFFRHKKMLVVHTAGSLPMRIFDGSGIADYGVLYPLQTFSRTRTIDMAGVPIFVEANSAENSSRLFSLAQRISGNARTITSDTRLRLHMAAVFACNYANHCLAIAADILSENGLPVDILHPLVRETFGKALSVAHPRTMQTGPAVRGDNSILQKHIALLSGNALRQRVYTTLVDSISADA